MSLYLYLRGLYDILTMYSSKHSQFMKCRFMSQNSTFSRFHVDLKTVETNIVIMWVDPLVATAEQVTNIQGYQQRLRL